VAAKKGPCPYGVSWMHVAILEQEEGKMNLLDYVISLLMISFVMGYPMFLTVLFVWVWRNTGYVGKRELEVCG